MEMTRQFIN